MDPSDSPFLKAPADQIIYADELTLGLWDRYPVSPGHALVVTRRVVATWFDASREEQVAILDGIDRVKTRIEQEHKPHGFNIGINVGTVAGQTVEHLHVHVIPRYTGDVPDPTGGVRGVVPSRANYLRPSLDVITGREPTDSWLTTGGDQADRQLLPQLRREFDQAQRVDLALGFVMRSGVDLLFEHSRDLLSRTPANSDAPLLRILTGDYLGVTDPDALRRLLDLGDRLDLRVFEAGGGSFHPKSYIFHHADSEGVAFVGSSNLSEIALTSGVEWNYRAVSDRDQAGFQAVTAAFDELFAAPQVRVVDPEWIASYEKNRPVRVPPSGGAPEGPPDEPPPEVPEPHAIQKKALKALEATRAEGNRRGLVVLATGLGKTWLSAFDSDRPEFSRVLFVAHREEILTQAMDTFRRIRPHANLGLYTGKTKDRNADVLFASVQTLHRQAHLDRFDTGEFDYIVIDEFHHAEAKTYRRLLNHFEPKFLLGLTATPERSDGGDILALCDENLVFRCDLMDGIRAGLLSPFKYYGVPDDIDYENIPWRSGRFDPEALTNALTVERRADNALEQLRQLGGIRTLCFCCSVRHAEFMANYFRQNDLRAVAVHSQPTSAPRTSSLEALEAGDLDVVCAVDMFNEGVDLPLVDTVLLLRPTESSVLWLQQIGRGLRKTDDGEKSHLAIIDYIGNHRAFLLKPKTLLNVANERELIAALKMVDDRTLELPPGCEITYDLAVMDILQRLAAARIARTDTMETWYEDFKIRTGQRPRAVEAFHEHISLKSVRQNCGSWLHFVDAQGDLSGPGRACLQGHAGDFLRELETTRMSKSYEMIVLQALLSAGLPDRIPIDSIVEYFRRAAARSPMVKDELGDTLADDSALRRHIEENPINAWIGRESPTGAPFFRYEGAELISQATVPARNHEAFRDLVDELVEWRLAEYQSRYREQKGIGDGFVCRVTHNSSDAPILMLPSRDRHPSLPQGPTEFLINGRPHIADVVKIAINVVREESAGSNVLSDILRGWFGNNAGATGTTQTVRLLREDHGWTLQPIHAKTDRPGLDLYREYLTEKIKNLFAGGKRAGNWQSGYIRLDSDSVMLVTLRKQNVAEKYDYKDRFLGPDRFQWESPASTTQAGKEGQETIHHIADGRTMHLFVREQKKRRGRAVPYTYCGPVRLMEYEGEKPIRCMFTLDQPLPDDLLERFSSATAGRAD